MPATISPRHRNKFNLNQFGGSLGGPIRKDKTFFFIDYQAKMQRLGVPFMGLVPTTAMMAGDFTLDPLPAEVRNPVRQQNPVSQPRESIQRLRAVSMRCRREPYSGGAGGAQARGTHCNKIPASHDQPDRRKIDWALSHAQCQQAGFGLQLLTSP